MPCYNAVQTVESAVRSIEESGDFAWELVAVDDGSTDGTAEVLHRLAAEDARVRVVRLPHQGIVSALNAGLAECRAPLVARLDADDANFPGRLAAQVCYMQEHPFCGLVAGRVRFGDADFAGEGYRVFVEWINSVASAEDLRMRRFVESPFAHPSVCFRRSVVEGAGGYRDGEFPEDYELWLRLWDRGVPMAKLDRELVVWNDSPGRLSRTDGRYSPDAFYRTKAHYLAREIVRRTIAGDSRPVWVWGAGRPTRKRVRFLRNEGVVIQGYVDIDPRKIGQRLDGVPVISSVELPTAGSLLLLVYVGNRGAREIIATELREKGWVEGSDFFLCA